MTNREKLIELMDRFRVDSVTVGKILDLSPASVRIYRSKSGNDITDKDLELLKYKLEEGYRI